MSGGSYNYTYFQVEDQYVGKMYDIELDEMMSDLCGVLHDLEWWQSGDYIEEDYRETVQKFKEKWFGKRDERLRELVAKEIDEVKEKIMKL
jgi:Ni,Fe-hydrogenase III component G